MTPTAERPMLSSRLTNLLVGGLLLAAILGIAFIAPTEATMGHAQRILYVHVAVAWLALLGFIVMAATGLMYLLRRDLAWDHWSQAAAELGWLCCGLTLVTGSLWAHAAWNTWWTWDPRLVTSFALWAMYCGVLMVRANIDDPHRRARLGAVLALLGVLDVPLVALATRWFRSIHPVSPSMEPSMRVVLLLSIAGFSALFVLLFMRRRTQLRLESAIEALRRQTYEESFGSM